MGYVDFRGVGNLIVLLSSRQNVLDVRAGGFAPLFFFLRLCFQFILLELQPPLFFLDSLS